MSKLKGTINIDKNSGIPLIGLIHIGIIDRGTNLLQIRPSTACNMKCEFCSTNANNFEIHPYNFIVEQGYLIEWLKYAIKEKESNEIEANIDSMGEPTAYPQIIELITSISKIPEIKFISIQTNGTLLSKEKIKALEKAGLNRINLSIHSLQKNQSKKLFGSENYDIDKILDAIKSIKETKIELYMNPVWIPNINDKEIEKIIDLAKEVNAKLGIQKYEVYKYSRKMKGAKAETYWKFYDKLKKLEKEKKLKLIIGKEDFNIKKTKRIPTTMNIGENVNVEIKLPGWMPDQMIGVANDRCITINKCNDKIGDKIRVKITDNKNNIYLGKKL